MGVKSILNNNEFYQNAMINIRKDNDEWKNAAGTCSADLIEKSITKNGEYNAKEDGADGYSSVMVDVDLTTFTKLQILVPYNKIVEVYNNSSSTVSSTDGRAKTYINPIKKLTLTNYQDIDITFTPSEDFDGIYKSNNTKITFSGAEITAGDGKTYSAKINDRTNEYVIYKSNYDHSQWVCNIE